jgi:hypothetical protein
VQRDTFEHIRLSYNNRYTLTNRQLKDLLEKGRFRGYPESAWVRTILEIVKVGELDFALVARILKKFIMRPTSTQSDCPKLLQLIAYCLRDINLVEAIISII